MSDFKIKLLLKNFSDKKPLTVNEVIDNIYKKDIKSGKVRDGWKFYQQLNKKPAPMERAGLIEVVGTKTGPTKRIEKLWLKK